MKTKYASLLVGLLGGCATAQTPSQQVSNHSSEERLEEKTESDYYQDTIQKLRDNGATINSAVRYIHRYARSDYAEDLDKLKSKSEEASLDLYLQERGERLVLYQQINQERKVLTDKGNLYTYIYPDIKHTQSNGGKYLCAQASLRITLVEQGLDVAKTSQKMQEELRETIKKERQEFRQELERTKSKFIEEDFDENMGRDLDRYFGE